jgi:hypothetical protein
MSTATLDAMQNLAKTAVTKAIHDVFHEGKARMVVSDDAKSIVGRATKDGRILGEKGQTLAILQTNGTFVDPTGQNSKVDF